MPLMVSENGRQQRIVPGRSVGLYLSRGWTVAGEDDDTPNSSDPKADWVAYAESVGIDTAGMTKAEIVEAVGG